MKIVETLLSAELDMIRFHINIAKDSPTNADKQIYKIEKHIEKIGRMPNICRPLKYIFGVDTDFCRSIIKPYIVITKHFDTHIEVHRVFHGKENYVSKLFGL
ncbi:MAG: type II toxin-antitoxin system RelE/ParE family toxin [Firmicutes bacterium]|nr:type II toxin-antitoxin system RelE/ParE family toxin [Bacillota bacterium]